MVFENDTMIDLYDRMTQLMPSFVLGSLRILESLSETQINSCPKLQPILYKRGLINPTDLQEYKDTLPRLKKKYEKVNI